MMRFATTFRKIKLVIRPIMNVTLLVYLNTGSTKFSQIRRIKQPKISGNGKISLAKNVLLIIHLIV